jgi:hypothetical protein
VKKKIKVWETTEIVTILASHREGIYRVIWHRSDGEADEEFDVTPGPGDSVEEAVAKDLRARLGP